MTATIQVPFNVTLSKTYLILKLDLFLKSKVVNVYIFYIIIFKNHKKAGGKIRFFKTKLKT